MSRFVIKPNLPEDCKAVIIGEKYINKISKPLSELGIECISMPDNAFVSRPVSSHADISVCHTGGEGIWLAPSLRGSDFFKTLCELGMTPRFSDLPQSDEYRYETQLNICICGNKLINSKYSDKAIINYLTSREYTKIPVKQGYARCSVCVVSENAIITADRGIAEAFRADGGDALLISPGHIILDGYDYGFIGGASFKLRDDLIAFTGTLEEHPDYDRIIGFLGLHNVKPVYLTDNIIFDIGTAIPIIEKREQ